MIDIVHVERLDELREHASIDELTSFLHSSLIPYEDPEDQIRDSLDYAFSKAEGKGGFLLLAKEEEKLVGALVMLRTGMCGYVPPYILLYIAVEPDCRGKGIGGRLIEEAFRMTDGDIKLHVEHDNPASRLYERMGFRSKYAEMRYAK